ncbi:MAG: translocation/assembly module TamB domain-containing protein [Deltaproteobacteria bacterium]|nr:translocation/assembly module TamB domain-containing protein [Deltaproteobacteria bacterium]
MRLGRVLGVIGAVVGTTVTFTTAATAAVLLHLDVPATRRLVATQVTRVLRGQLAGDVAIERIGALGLHGVEGVRVRVKDPAGAQVLFVDGVRVRVSGIGAARSAVFGKGDIVVNVDAVSIDHVDAAIDGDGTPEGSLRLARAFEPKTKGPETPPDPNARGVRVEALDVVLHHAWVHGAAPGAPFVDADVSQLVGRAHYDPTVTKATLDRVDLVTRNLSPKVDPTGRVSGRVSIPSDPAKQNEMLVEARFDGAVANVPTTARATMLGEAIDAVADVHGVTGERVRPAFGELPIREEVSAHAEVHGTTREMKAIAKVIVGSGTVDVDAEVDLREGTKIGGTVTARHLDARAALADAPPTDLNLDARSRVTIPNSGAVSGDFALDMLPSRLDRDDLPRVAVRGELSRPSLRAKATIDDARVPTEIRVAMREIGGARVVDAEVDATVPELAKLPTLKRLARGSASIHAEAHVDLSAKVIDGRATVKGQRLAMAGDGAEPSIDDLVVSARAWGRFERPVVQLGAHAGHVRAAGRTIASADVRGEVELGKTIVLRDGLVDLVTEGQPVGVSARRVAVDGTDLRAEGITLRGIGEPILADLSLSGGATRVKVDAPAIDLARVARLAGRPGDITQGTMAVTGEVAIEREGARGEVRITADSVRSHGIDDATLDLRTTLDGRNVDVDVETTFGEAGTLSVHTKRFVLGGRPSDPSSWAQARGSAKISADIDLAKMAALVPEGTLPVGELAGRVVVAGALRRDSADVPPELSLHAHTRGLVASGATAPESAFGATKVKGIAPWRTQGLDVGVDAKVDATSGFCEIAARAWDRLGTVAAFDAKADLPYRQLFAEPAAAMGALKQAPIVVKARVPKRDLSAMPAALALDGFKGSVEAEIDAHGTLLDPRVDVAVHGRGVRAPALPITMTTDADLTVGYDGKAGDVVLRAKAGGRDALELTAHADVNVRDLVEGPRGELPWTGSAKAKLASFPLQAVAPLADLRVRGRVSGEATIDDLHRDAKMHARLGFEQLAIGRARYETGLVAVDAHEGKLEANVRLDQTDGYADIRAKAGMKWGAAVAPSLDEGAPLEARLDAKAFRAAAAAPFVRTVMNELDGRVDANTTIRIEPGRADPTMEGRIVFREGRVQLAALGDEMRDVRATVTLQRDGVIAVDDVYARSLDGRLNADARVELDGFGLRSARANVRIPKDHRFDVALQGAPIGEVFGEIHVDAKAAADRKKLAVTVDVPQLEVRLSETMKSGVQELAEPERIRVGTYRDAKTFVRLPMDADDIAPKKAKQEGDGSTTTLDVKLGDITVVYGRMARLSLGGAPHVEIGAGEPKVTGQVTVKQGTIDVQGKEFEVEKCTVTFQESDAANPIVIATAGWEADDGTKVYADFVGPVKTGKVTLRSEPSRPRNEILAIILFGTADGANAQPPPAGRAPDGTTKAAVGVGGGFAAQGLTEAMDDLTGVDATARIDSSRANNPAPEIEVQISRRVSLAVQHVLGTPPITQPDKNLAIIDWRFRRNWSLETTFGDRGKAQLDAVWQKRY